MQFTTSVVALFSILSSTGLAANVFSSFLDANGAQIGSTNFDVGNDGCFSVSGASQVSFSQAGPTENADGPYCLSGFDESGCNGDAAATQQFQDVSVTGRVYQLDQNINGAGSFRWNLGEC